MNTVHLMTIGEPFNSLEACGFHPEEIISRRHNLTDGQRFLYERVVRRARARDGDRANERALIVGRAPFTTRPFGGPRCLRFLPNCTLAPEGAPV